MRFDPTVEESEIRQWQPVGGDRAFLGDTGSSTLPQDKT